MNGSPAKLLKPKDIRIRSAIPHLGDRSQFLFEVPGLARPVLVVTSLDDDAHAPREGSEAFLAIGKDAILVLVAD